MNQDDLELGGVGRDLIQNRFATRVWQFLRNRVRQIESMAAKVPHRPASDRLPTTTILLRSWFGA
jgi:hypothetical protein